jgi:hypothetical protein
MDADDFSLPDRLAQQHAYLQKHPEIDILGAGVQHILSSGKVQRDLSLQPSLPGHVHWSLLFYCSISHPTVMARNRVLGELEGYNAEFTPAEDYELWLRAAEAGFRIANISKPLVNYRVNPSGMSHSPGSIQEQIALRLSARALQQFLGPNADIDRKVLYALKRPELLARTEDIQRLVNQATDLVHSTISKVATEGASSEELREIRRHGRRLTQRLHWHAARKYPGNFLVPRRTQTLRTWSAIGSYSANRAAEQLSRIAKRIRS